jgi:hypothetical protein
VSPGLPHTSLAQVFGVCRCRQAYLQTCVHQQALADGPQRRRRLMMRSNTGRGKSPRSIQRPLESGDASLHHTVWALHTCTYIQHEELTCIVQAFDRKHTSTFEPGGKGIRPRIGRNRRLSRCANKSSSNHSAYNCTRHSNDKYTKRASTHTTHSLTSRTLQCKAAKHGPQSQWA